MTGIESSVVIPEQDESKPNGVGDKIHTRAVVPLNLTHDMDKATECLKKAFADSPSFDYLMKKFFNVPIDQFCSKDRVFSMLNYFMHEYNDAGAETVEANDFDAVAVWTPPDCDFHQSHSNDPEFNDIFFRQLGDKTKEVLPEGVRQYYLFLIGKDLTRPDIRGSVRQIFNTYKQKADAANSALVLEAISESAKKVYEYFGFKNYLTFHYGKNECDAQGNYDPQGEGFTAYLMIYYKDDLPGFIP